MRVTMALRKAASADAIPVAIAARLPREGGSLATIRMPISTRFPARLGIDAAGESRALLRNKFGAERVVGPVQTQEVLMDKDRVVGSTKVVKGKIKEAVGKAAGDTKLETQGKTDKIEGKVQNAVGGLKDTLRGK